MITVIIPSDDLYLLQSDSLSVKFNDTITGAGDGYAIDCNQLAPGVYWLEVRINKQRLVRKVVVTG